MVKYVTSDEFLKLMRDSPNWAIELNADGEAAKMILHVIDMSETNQDLIIPGYIAPACPSPGSSSYEKWKDFECEVNRIVDLARAGNYRKEIYRGS